MAKNIIRLLALLLSLAVMVAALVGCGLGQKSNVIDPVIEYKGEGIPTSFYSLMLSRMKGTLARNKYDVKSDSFWAKTVDGTDMTYEEYFNSMILDECRIYLCVLAFFEEEGLTLPESVIDAIDEEIEYYVSLGYVGGGSVEKLDEILAPYGVDSESLREAYEIEAKYSYLLAYLYGTDGSLIADNVKDDFYRNNYYRFKQIILPNYYYEFEIDDFGDEIYFDEESGRPLYDSENGSVMYDADGSRIKNEYGDVIYFDSLGNILYDKENGKRSVVLDENGEAMPIFFTDRELEARAELAQSIAESLEVGDFDTFEALMSQYNVNYGEAESYPDGYYLSRLEESGYEGYMVEMLASLEEMEVGECCYLESEYGQHIIMKYELDSGKYADGNYSEWFGAFTESLISALFSNKCQSVQDKITVNEENIANAKSIKELGINFDY